MKGNLQDILERYWGYTSFRPMQSEVIESVLGGTDTLALMPTGAGKSLLYQVPAMASKGVCIVVTPLIALMKDQVDRLRRMGIPACAVHSGLSTRQIDILLDNCVYGDMKFLYVAPERIASETFRMRLTRMNVCLLAVDEAHCISQWGYDFRPAYLRIAEIRRLIPDTPVLALTASATGDVVTDIMRHLKFRDGTVLRSSFARPNLSYSVRRTEDKPQQLLRIVRGVPGTGIVYVRLRESTEEVASLLRSEGVTAEAYHGGLPHTERAARQERWMNGESRVMVATNAFGMGIDKADVRFVVHYDLCDSPEAYYQEAGRAGRDGRRSYAVLLFSPDEPSRATRRFNTEFPSVETIRSCYEAVFNYLQIGIGEGKESAFDFDLRDFAARSRLFPATALSAIKILEQNGYWELSDENDRPPRIMFTVSRDDLYKIRIDRQELDHFLRTILRLYDGVFSHFVRVDEQQIADCSGYTVPRVRELFENLWKLRVIRYIPGKRSALLYLSEERLPTGDVIISPESYRIRKRLSGERMVSLFRYAENESECRSVLLRRYFGEENPEPCGICDICLRHKKAKPAPSQNGPAGEESGSASGLRAEPGGPPPTEGALLETLAAGPLPVKELFARFTAPPEEVASVVDRLLAEGKISLDAGGRIGIK